MIDDNLNILITGGGSPGIAGTIYSLRNNYDKRKVRIISTDMNPEAVGKFLSDKFYAIPPAIQERNYLEKLCDICSIEKVQILIPQNTAELLILASNKEMFRKLGTKILVSGNKAITIANNKYELMKTCTENNIPTAKFYKINNYEDLEKIALKLGWPGNPIVVKPPISNGMRGVRIINEKTKYKENFYKEKPTSLFTKMTNLKEVLGEKFPELIVMEYLPGLEYSVDVFRDKKKCIVIPRKRDSIRSGITFNGSLEKNKLIIEYSKKLSHILNLKGCFGFQFIVDDKGIPKILESNPRVQGTMVMSTMAGANLIYSGVKMFLNESIPDFNIDWDSKFFRYWGGFGISGGENDISRI